MKLKDSHKRVLNTLVLLTEQKLFDIELSFIKPGLRQPAHLSYIDDLSPEQIEDLRAVMRQLQDELKKLSQVYPVRAESKSIQREVLTGIVFLWEMLCEYTNGRLTQYGHMEEEVLEDIDNRVNRMIQLTLKMERICNYDAQP